MSGTSKKLVGIVLPNLSSGGAERISINLARAFIERGHKVHVFLLRAKIEFPDVDDLNIIDLEADLGFTLGRTAKSRKYAALLKNKLTEIEQSYGKSFDLILSNLNKAHDVCRQLNHPAIRYCFHNSIKHYVRLAKKQGYFKHRWLLQLYRHMSQGEVIAVSEGVAKEIRETPYLNPQKLAVIYNPYSAEEIRLRACAEIDTSAIGNTEYIINVARPVHIKRHDILFDAMQYIDPKYTLVLVGKGTEKLLPMAKSKGLADRVIVMGHQENPYPLIKNARLLLLSSDNEGFGSVLLEALACDTPVVSTDCEWGPSEILTGDLAQCLTKVGDAKALGEKANSLLASDFDIGEPEIIEKVSYENVTRQYLAMSN